MSTEKIGPIPSEKGKQKPSEASEPDSDAFKEMMKVGQTRETDFDEQSARKYSQPIEEEEEKEPNAPSSSDIYYYHKQSQESTPYESDKTATEPKMKGKTSPQSPEFYIEMGKKKLNPELKKMGHLVDKELKSAKSKISPTVSTKKEGIIPQTKTLLMGEKASIDQQLLARETLLSERGKEIKEAELHAPKVKIETADLKNISENLTKAKIPIPETEKKEEKTLDKKAEFHFKKEKYFTEKKEKKEELTVSPYQTLDLSPNQLAQSEVIAAKLASNLNPEIVPLLEHMIGALIQFSTKGVSETQIILNNSKFENSRFYNSKIIFQKYASAPHSYNIKLTGSQEAVSIFNENIEGLYKKLSQADLDFEIGQLSAEYERPLFRRKASIGKFDRDTKSR